MRGPSPLLKEVMSASLLSRLYHTKRFRTSDILGRGKRENALLFVVNFAFLVFFVMGSHLGRGLAPQALEKL
jgi:hypothetical protein